MSDNKITRRSLKVSAPRFLQELSVREENDVKTMECRVDGYPRPDIRWEKFGKVVGKSRRIHMTRSGDKCLLQIKMLQAEDHGLYSCIATNIVGMATTQTKISTPYLGSRKLHGTSPSPSSNKTILIRSQSSEKPVSGKSLPNSSSKTKSNRNVFRIRSRSGSGKNRQENIRQSLKSKASFTSHLWNNSSENVSNPIDKVKNLDNVLKSDQKRLCKSMEDCRKAKMSFLNRVKIPDIFSSTQKDSKASVPISVLHPSQKINGVKGSNGASKPSENSNSKPNENSTKPNENSAEFCSENKLLDNESVAIGREINSKSGKEDNSTPLTTKERIAAYLKRFESTTANKLKEPSSDKISKKYFSLRKKTDENKDTKVSSPSENDSNFFSFAKFRRRKSSPGGSNIRNSSKNLRENLPEESNGCQDTSNGVLKIEHQPLLNGDSLLEHNIILKDYIEEGGSEDNKMGFATNDEMVHNQSNDLDDDIDLNSLTFEQIDVTILNELDPFQENGYEPLQQVMNKEDDTVESFTNTSLPVIENGKPLDFDETVIPSICIQLTSEDNGEDNKGINEINTTNEVFVTCSDVNSTPVALVINKSSEKCERLKESPVIEEKCELLLSNGETEGEEADVQTTVPTPARIVKGPQSVTILRGESVTLAISFTGVPAPTVTWMKGGRILKNNEHLSILEGREMSVVTVNEVTADDSGKYVVSVENDGGGDSCFASVAVVGFPEPPGGEPTATEVTDHSVVLSWYGSMYDGGSVVTGYLVEMCSLPDKTWYKVSSSVNTSCTVQGLSKGQRYLFRVKAENRYGLSHPSKESKVICLDDFLQDTSSDEDTSSELGDESHNVITVDNGTEFAERFDLKEEVGKGRFGTVYRCVEKSCGRPRAAKIIRCLKMKDKEKVRQEIEIMSRLHHPKLMQVLAAFESGRNMIMVMEFISGGELFERVIADDFILTEQDCILFMQQICSGVAYMHKNDVIHLDLKPENILCKTRTSHKIKIIDFGLARFYNAEENLRVLFGTPEFVAPEVINYEPVCPASDMWSVGVVCYVLISGLSPFMGDSDTETFANITRGEMDFDDEAFDDISNDAKDFISKLLVKKLRGRMSAEECLSHPWLATASPVQKKPLSTEKLKRFIIRRKWQKSGTAIRALGRMVSLSRSSLGSCCDSPLGSPLSSRSCSSLLSRSETAESTESDICQETSR